MSEIANRRKFLEAAQTLARARQADMAQVVNVMLTLGVVLSDLTGERVVLEPKVVKSKPE